MVSRPIVLLLAPVLAPLGGALEARAQVPGPPGGPSSAADAAAIDEVRRALGGRRFPWYDPSADAYRPVMPPRPPSPSSRWDWGGSWLDLPDLGLPDLGRLIIFVLLASGLMALILFVARTWRRRIGPESRAARPEPALVSGSEPRVGTLPAGLAIDDSDPIEAARRFRDRGELGRAVVMLFAHQLLALDRLGMIRLAPGRTGRQLVRSIPDDVARGSVGRTLRMFEAVYYGHREPDPAAFAALWAEAESLDRALGTGAPR